MADSTKPLPVPPPRAAGGIAARAMAAARGTHFGYLDGLNPEQRLAVETLDGPVLVLAGAGTGKTRVLTTRIAHILNLGRAHPSQILAVTFTNKAAREMKLRVGQMVGEIVEGMPWLGTFHSIGVKILRRHAELVGLKSGFTILDTDDQIRLIKQLLEAENIDEKRWPARVFAGVMDGWKNRGLTPEQVPAGEAMSFANGRGFELYKAYQERLKILNAVDFGDLLLETIRLFRENPDVLRDYQRRFRYILVDEYQDTNVAQYLWLRLLAQSSTSPSPSASSPGRREASSHRKSDSSDLRIDDAETRVDPSFGAPDQASTVPTTRDGRDKPGHDEGERGAALTSQSSLPGGRSEAPSSRLETRQSIVSQEDGSPDHDAPAVRRPGDDEGEKGAALTSQSSLPGGRREAPSSRLETRQSIVSQEDGSPGHDAPAVRRPGDDEEGEAVVPGCPEGADPESITTDQDYHKIAARGLAPAPVAPHREIGERERAASGEREKEIKNICCVGDDDQSIYGWRGAEVDNILRFEKDFPGAIVIRLERNYRSTGHILAAASHLIAHNEGRLGKTLRTEDVPGEKVTVTGAWDSEEEARAIGDEIEELQRAKHPLNEIAILVRASFQMREFEDRFVTLGLPYRVIGGPRFYERAEIRDALAYLRVVNSASDDLAFERIVNVPRRGLGDATLQQLHDYARARRIPLFEAARAMIETDELKPRPRGSLRDLVTSFERWRAQNETMPHDELAEIVLDESGYTAMWQKDRSADAAGRLENLKELIRSMQDFENLAGFLEHISLVMDRDGEGLDDAVNIMTLHSAKGLEFDTVFLPGWEEGLFPHQRALDESGRAGLEEERRLAHVGLTRARRRAKLYFATNRRMHGLWNSTIPSRFLDELPEQHVEVTESKSSFGGAAYGGMGGGYGPSRFDSFAPSGSSYSTPGWQRAQKRRAREDDFGFGDEGSEYDTEARFIDEDTGGAARSAKSPPPLWGRDREGGRAGSHSARKTGTSKGRFAARREPLTIEGELVAKSTGTSQFTVGDRVFHIKFGNGNVTSIDGNKLTIQFDKAGEKRVVDSFVERV
ncbi:MAG: ATP-dependent helicase [Pseudorhodoplanes sp.]|nr:ATP-dependent helicase [Pseudorhodoplanes sp.]